MPNITYWTFKYDRKAFNDWSRYLPYEKTKAAAENDRNRFIRSYKAKIKKDKKLMPGPVYKVVKPMFIAGTAKAKKPKTTTKTTKKPKKN